jgi:hypothetical protein
MIAVFPHVVMARFIAFISGAVCARVAEQMGKRLWPWFPVGLCLPNLSVVFALPILYVDWINREPRP